MWHYNYSPLPDELYHYGVKGMKWKKRKAKGQSVWDKYAKNYQTLDRTGRINSRVSAGLYNTSRKVNQLGTQARRRKNQSDGIRRKINSALEKGAGSVSESLRKASVKRKKKANKSFHNANYWGKKVKSKQALDRRYQQRRLKGER